MDLLSRMRALGFDPVIVLDGAGVDEALSAGVGAPTLLLVMMTYTPRPVPQEAGAHVHPYYYVSQRAYRSAEQLVREAQAEGIGLRLRDEIRVKPIFARLPGFHQGRNTLSYAGEHGSRFHVQIFACDEKLPPTHALEAQPHERHCGECTLCMQACPTHAIDEEGFHRERCLRNWQLSGRPVPAELRAAMGSRLIGCDECQRRCPHNAPPPAEWDGPADLPLSRILEDPKGASAQLRERIGANLALPNRVLAQALLCAGASGDSALLPAAEALCGHPSPTVVEHARWAVDALRHP